MSKADLKILMQKLGHEFNDPKILDLAVTHRSKSQNHNERLEFLGDAVLDLVLSKLLYCKFPISPEGELTTARAKLVCADFLQGIASELSLADYLHVGQSQLAEKISPSILSDAVEAVLGAIFIDAGYGACEAVITNIYKAHLDNFDIKSNIKDFKTMLQEFTQKNLYHLPVYSIEKITGASHQQTFSVKCCINERDLNAVALGDSKRKAEQAAAEKILNMLDGNKNV